MEWFEHDGGVSPKHAKMTDSVLVKFRDGHEALAPQTVAEWFPCWKWDRRWPGDSEIVEYRRA